MDQTQLCPARCSLVILAEAVRVMIYCNKLYLATIENRPGLECGMTRQRAKWNVLVLRLSMSQQSEDDAPDSLR